MSSNMQRAAEMLPKYEMNYMQMKNESINQGMIKMRAHAKIKGSSLTRSRQGLRQNFMRIPVR